MRAVLLGNRLAALLALLITAAASTSGLAASIDDPSQTLLNNDAFVTSVRLSGVHAGDLRRLNDQANAAYAKGVPEKFAIVNGYPKNIPNASQDAEALRFYLDFSGVLVVVTPKEVGVASDELGPTDLSAIAHQAKRECAPGALASCAVLAGRLAVPRVLANKSSSTHDAVVFWIVVGSGLLVLALIAILSFRLRRFRKPGNIGDLRSAAVESFYVLDRAIQQVRGSNRPLSAEDKAGVDEAAQLRSRHNAKLDRPDADSLIEANEEAARAILRLQSLSGETGIATILSPSSSAESNRCFYCATQGHGSYSDRTIDDGDGHHLQVQICGRCIETLGRGRTPKVATVTHGGLILPWWAVPDSPWYARYGGPAWQHWLPFVIAMDVGAWFEGGWSGVYTR